MDANIKSWLERLQLGTLNSLFEKNAIHAEDIPSLSEQDLLDMGIVDENARARILLAVQRGDVPNATSPPTDTLAGVTQFSVDGNVPSNDSASSVLSSSGSTLAGQTAFQPETMQPGFPLSGATQFSDPVDSAASSNRTAFASDVDETEVQSSSSAEMGITPDTKFRDRYRVLALLGEGAMGRVFRAFDEQTQTDVAIKSLWPAHQQNQQLMTMMAKEVALAQRVSHPNLLRLFHFDKEPVPHLIMELIDGQNLTEHWAASHKKLSPEEALPILEDVLRALEALHAENLFHRDVKPDNVLLTKDKKVKLSDYGVASTLREQLKKGSRAGTPYYMAPEQFEGHADARSDLYAVAIMAHQLLLGKFPFPADDLESVRNWHVCGVRNLTSLSELPGGRVFVRALAQNPEQRYASATAMLQELRTSLHPLPPTVAAPAAAPLPRSSAPTKMPYIVAAGVIAGVVAAALGGAFVVSSRAPEKAEEARAQQDESPRDPKPSAPQPTVPNEPKYWAYQNNEQQGPFTVAELEKMARRAEIQSGTQILKEGTQKWVAASSLSLPFAPPKRPPVEASPEREAPKSEPKKPPKSIEPIASASSTLAPQRSRGRVFDYEPQNAFDGRSDTAWVEDDSGHGYGEWLKIDFRQKRTIAAVSVDGEYKGKKNSRLKEVRLHFSDGKKQKLKLRDKKGTQRFRLSAPVTTEFVKFEIVKVFPGEKYKDTPITDIEFEFVDG